MSQHKIWPALALCGAALLAGGAVAQGGGGGGMTGNSTATGAMPKPTDTAPPDEPAQRVDPSASDSMSGGGDSKTASAPKKHSKKRAKAKTPKPADNDNNATPNTVKPDSSPQ